MRFLFFLIFIPLFCKGQNFDTVIATEIYKSFYSFKLKQPQFVVYHLYKGGGKCDRSDLFFKTAGLKNSASNEDYRNSGFDQGHLANFEDFAYDCRLAELTFRFYNAIPQTPILNRGEWKSYEAIIRNLSQTDSLIIVTGGSKYRKKIGDGVSVPQYCWKVVYSKKKKKIIMSLWFRNSLEKGPPVKTSIESLNKRLGYDIRKFVR